MKKLILDFGHSKRFQGANGFKNEVEWVRTIGKFLIPQIQASKWKVMMVPETYWNDYSANSCLVHRINWINRNSTGADYLLSIHANAANSPRVRGVITCYYGGSTKSEKEATLLSHCYATATGIPLFTDGAMADTESRFGRLGIIRDTHPFALLVECGFVTNFQDMAIDPKLAAQGIANYFNSLS